MGGGARVRRVLVFVGLAAMPLVVPDVRAPIDASQISVASAWVPS